MARLTDSQLALLHLSQWAPGPSIADMCFYGPLYGVEPGTLRKDLIALLEERFFRPLGQIDPLHYLPSISDVTPAGKAFLAHVAAETPRRLKTPTKDEEVELMHRTEPSRRAVTALWPTLPAMTADEVVTLADCYLHWAADAEIGGPDLYIIAAAGFSRANDVRRFAKAISSGFQLLQTSGDYMKLSVVADHLLVDHPHRKDVVLGAASLVLDEPYQLLTGRSLSAIESIAQYRELLRELFTVAEDTGQHYTIPPLSSNALAAIGNRIEDLLAVAFHSGSRRLFHQVVELQFHLIELLHSSVAVGPQAAAFESRAGYAGKIGLAQRTSQVLERFSDTVLLPENEKAQALKIVTDIVRSIDQCAFSPVRHLRDDSDVAARATLWIFNLLGINELALRSRHIRLFERLHELGVAPAEVPRAAAGPTSATLLGEPTLVQLLGQINDRLATIERNAADTDVIRFVLLPAIEDQLGLLLDLTIHNHADLERWCGILLRSERVLGRIDASLHSAVPELKRDVQQWMDTISTQVAAGADRDTFLKALGEIVKLSNAAKIVASIPLIPGFVHYQYETEVKFDLNKWLSRVRALFTSGGATSA